MIKALGNVMPRHLLDRRLNPVGEIRSAISTKLEECLPADVSAEASAKVEALAKVGDDVSADVPLIPLMLK
jgi:hypothetical protein